MVVRQHSGSGKHRGTHADQDSSAKFKVWKSKFVVFDQGFRFSRLHKASEQKRVCLSLIVEDLHVLAGRP